MIAARQVEELQPRPLSRGLTLLFSDGQRTIPITISEFTISTYSSSSFYLQSSELQRDARPRLQIDTCHGSERRGKERKKRARNRSRPGNKLDLTTHTHVASGFKVWAEVEWGRPVKFPPTHSYSSAPSCVITERTRVGDFNAPVRSKREE